MAPHELTYQEAMALLPGYAAGILHEERRAAVDHYLQQQIDLFRHLNELEEVSGRQPAASGEAKQPHDPASYAQLMEGERPGHFQPHNPLLMRNAPQTYHDRRTGQRFVVPKRGTLQEERAPRAFPAPPMRLQDRLRTWGWNLLAVAAVVAVILILAYQIQLQGQIAAAQAQLTLMQEAERVLVMTSNGDTTTMRGALYLNGQQALLTVSGLDPLPSTQVYQLWYTTAEGQQVSGGVLSQATVVDTPQMFEIPHSATAIVAVGISVEAAGGSPVPTTPMALNGIHGQ